MNHLDEARIAEQAWNNTKVRTNPRYRDCLLQHQLQLATMVNDLDQYKTSTGIAGFAAYEMKVAEILALEALEPFPKVIDLTDTQGGLDMNSRDAALVAEQAWNETKTAEDPEFIGCARDHQFKLVNAVDDLALHFGETGYTTGIEGLEHFEEHVTDILTLQAAEAAAQALLTEGEGVVEDAATKRKREEDKNPELKRKREKE